MTAPQHQKTSGSLRRSRRPGPAGVAAIVGAVVVVAALTVGAVALTGHAGPAAKSSTGTKSPTTTPSTVPSTTATTLPPLTPLTVRWITPSRAAAHVATASLITIRFSVRLAATSPEPTLSPAVAGRWALRGNSWIFRPTAGYIPETTETVSVTTRTGASEEGRRVHLATAYRSSFTVGRGSILRLQQLLAELHYLPFTFNRITTRATATATGATSLRAAVLTAATSTLATSTVATVTALKQEASIAAGVAVGPQAGRLSWAYPDIPPSLSSLWSEGRADTITNGAVMAFEADHGLGVDGVAGPRVWTALVQAVAARQINPRPYSYVEVSENQPELLTVWQNGRNDVYSSPANTGVPGADTQHGTFPVFLRYTTHSMKGTDPNGTTYNDPAIPWIAYFNGGDAIHGYPRASYGFPQSNGCVELPIANAAMMFNSGDDWYGTLVNVS